MTVIDAVLDGNVGRLIELLQDGADPNWVEDEGLVTPLHFAAQNDQSEIAELLIVAGANLFARSAFDQLMPLEVAYLHEKWEVAAVLTRYHELCVNFLLVAYQQWLA